MIRSPRLKLPTWVYLVIGDRDKWTCQGCDQGYMSGPDWRWTIDHWKALAKGGTNHLDNLRLVHRRCNGDKSDA